VQPDHGREIHFGQHIAVEHDDRVSEEFLGVLDRAGRAERLRLDDISNAQAELRSVAENLFDAPRLVIEAENDLVDFRDRPEQIELIEQERAVEDWDDGLRRVGRQRAQPRAHPAGQQDCLHDSLRVYRHSASPFPLPIRTP
jgi:hypothetical protein